MKKLLLSFFLLLFLALCYGQKNVGWVQKEIDKLDQIHPQTFNMAKSQGSIFFIRVRNQREFEKVDTEITKAIDSGWKNIRVKLGRGTYQFKENHIQLKDIRKEVAITITGKDAMLTSYTDVKNADNDPWTDMMQMDDIIQVVDNDKNLCMIPYQNHWNEDMSKSMTRVQVTQCFRAPVYDVESVDSNGIYFVSKTLKWEKGYKRKSYNVNYDYLFLGKTPRFRLYDKRKAVTGMASCFLSVENVDGVMLNISGIKFKGNKSGASLISMSNVASKMLYIHDCTFERIHGNVGSFSNVSNVIFDNNTVRNTDGNEVRFVKNCNNVRVTNNKFDTCGLSIGQTFCVTCWECSYYVANNTFSDFGYAAIGVGVWHGFSKKYLSKGIIEHNEIYFSPIYFAENWKYMLMDSGAIYTWTQNDEVIIRYNYIHDYAGAGDNRGMFCDDGANNLKIYGNIVLNTPNSYSIDLRYVKDQHDGFTNNANNFMAYNIVDNGIRFIGYDGVERHCLKGENYVVMKKRKQQIVACRYEGLEVNEEDKELDEKLLKLELLRTKNIKTHVDIVPNMIIRNTLSNLGETKQGM